MPKRTCVTLILWLIVLTGCGGNGDSSSLDPTDELTRPLKSPDVEKRRDAVREIRDLDWPSMPEKILDSLLAALTDSDATVRRIATETVLRASDQQCIKVAKRLDEAAQNETNNNVKAAMHRGVEQLNKRIENMLK